MNIKKLSQDRALNAGVAQSRISKKIDEVIEEIESQDTRISDLESGGDSFTELTIQGNAAEGYGLLKLKTKTASVTFSGGATETIEVEIPDNTFIFAIQLRNDTTLTATTGVSYTPDLSGGSSLLPTDPIDFVKNTKINFAGLNLLLTEMKNIVLTPDAGTLDTGTVTAVVYYWELTSLTDIN